MPDQGRVGPLILMPLKETQMPSAFASRGETE